MASTSAIPIPAAVHSFFSKFPLYTYPSEDIATSRNTARYIKSTLWIAPPKPTAGSSSNILSTDVECLKWQAYLALRGVKDIGVRWDIAAEGSVDGRLPSLVAVEEGETEVLGTRMIPGWVDGVLGKEEEDAFEGYKDDTAKDESRAWVALLEGIVHSALTLAKPTPITLTSLLLYSPRSPTARSSPPSQPSLATLLSPPPAPFSGFTTIFPIYGERVSLSSIQAQYRDAIISLSDRLGEDIWFLGSSGPTALDALVFAYLCCLLSGPDDIRLDVARRTNLVNWERRVRSIVQIAFVPV
ncbi:hypothetical protein DFH11DRAFT_1724243 [Phellopilus nigrolimitatus]|nr:hypothetical protein DFH11DRAFT_1724243 [Phellopilus nigrolimitatus]